MAPLIFKLGTRCKLVISFTTLLLHLSYFRYPSNTKLGVSWRPTGSPKEEDNITEE